MKRPTFLLCWLVPVFFLGGCATPPAGNAGAQSAGGGENGARAYAESNPSFSGAYPRPLSDAQPASEEEKRARIHVELGLGYYELGRTEVALDEAKAALASKSGYPPAYYLMGLVYMGLKQNTLAEEAFRRALSAAPGDPDFNNGYGLFLCNQKRVSEALSRYATSSANPYYLYKTRPFTNAGQCLLENNELVRAESQFSKALEADPSNSEALYRLAEIAYRRGNFRGAHDLLIQYHRRFNLSARSVWLGLRAARRAGDRHTEASYAEQLRSRFAGSPENVLMMQGKYE
ncbi:MAG: type IV pilus biogenesis/stability protein PilW [Azoarcus sp.]|jgi:type IV pilus assembly protein PilF|nr:type IV pilus biogenesis/stability protein PilW [Azoarcus sp.]